MKLTNRYSLFAALLIIMSFYFYETSSQSPKVHQKNADSVSSSKPQKSEPKASRETASIGSIGSDKYRSIKECLKGPTANCNYPETDPFAYEYSVTEDLAKEIQRFSQISQSPENLEALALDAIDIPSGNVQREALKILSKLPPNAKALSALKKSLPVSADPLIMSEATPTLLSYKDTPLSAEMHAFVSQQIQNGGHYSQKELAQQVHRFIDSASVATYQQTLLSLPKDSLAYRKLAAALHEYSAQQSGN